MPHRRTGLLVMRAVLAAGLLAAIAFAATVVDAAIPNPYPGGSRGNDVSFPQCGGPLPDPLSFNIIGVNGGRPFTENPCLFDQYAWATLSPMAPSVYINTSAAIGSNAHRGNSGPAGDCAPEDLMCIGYNFGFNAAMDAYQYAESEGVTAQYWWLDVETGNSWWVDTAANARSIQGAAEFLSLAGRTVGVYSTSYQWGVIAGNYRPGLPTWFATGAGYADAPDYCTSPNDFAGGGVWLIQYYGGDYDANYACGSPPTPAPTSTATQTPLPTNTLPPEVTATATATATVTPIPTIAVRLGDVSCNREVNAIDVALVLQYDAGLLAALACPNAADPNRDGSINSIDAALILQYTARLIEL